MAAPDLPLILEALEVLDREVVRLTHHVARDEAPVIRASLPARVTRIEQAIRAVRDRVLDSATELSIERFESAFRARTILVQIQLQDLKAAEPQVSQRMWPSSGRFQTLRQVSAFVLDGIGRCNALWIENRSLVDGAPPSVRHQALVTAVAKAEREFLDLGKDADFVCFLALGAALSVPRIRDACRVMAALFDVAFAPPEPRRPATLVQRLASYSPTIEVVIAADHADTEEVGE